MIPVNIAGYNLSEQLYDGSRTLVYRGYRQTDSLAVVIKLLKNPSPSFSELLSFRNQYTIAKNLKSPLIIQTYSLEPYQNGYALVMEDFGGISLKDYFTCQETLHTKSLQEFLLLAIAMSNALEILYRNQIIHKDIKPSNILINPETRQVKLIDFSIASLLPRETQTLINPNILQGTLAYISPEQTGRMNRLIDYRSDFYSLGVTFYELLTGELPFKSSDPMELLHCHIARVAPLVDEINPHIPSVISAIVSKLMAKNAEDRYQSALGLKHDLETCWHQLKETDVIKSFAIAQRDVCDRFIIPDKLYGREAQIETLLQAFERVSLGATEMMLVAGASGIGKTAVVNEVHKPIVRQRGYFVKGKYDQFQRNIPFSAFVQAFRDLMGQLLTESDAQIQHFKSKILDAVGENGQVIIEVIPELSRIIGEQPPAPELSGTTSENRFNLLFQKFTQVFTSAEHPLVMFLDDLQWVDSASLKLMQLLMADTGHFFLIGAYRDNEVNPAHPLMLTLNEIEKTAAKINTITLAPLSQGQVNQLVADTLKCTENLAWNLSVLIARKTEGNPFFATQFLKALHQDKFIQFNFELGCWQCDIAQVNQQALTDDVVVFIGFQLRKLPQPTQNVLQLAACIGNQFDLATLVMVSEASEIETAADLWKALEEGLILPISDVYKFYVSQESQAVTQKISHTVKYKFLHDRIQQAAYSLIPENKKQSTHLKIGQLLLSNIPKEEQEGRIFEIVNQLNIGEALITLQLERDELSQLNLIAGRKAKVSTAYTAALKYLTVGLGLLASDSWDSQYSLTLDLYIEISETAYLSTDFEQMDKWAYIVLQKAKTLLDKVKIYEVKIIALIAQNKPLAAITQALEVLNLLGISLPKKPNKFQILCGLVETKLALRGKLIENLINQPLMIETSKLAAMRILANVFSAAYFAVPELVPLIVFQQIKLSVKYGNTSVSTFAYALYGLILCGQLGDIDAGFEFGQLALNLVQKLNAKEYKAKTVIIVNCFILHWKKSVTEILQPCIDNYQTALESGDLEYAAHSVNVHAYYSYLSGQELTEVQQVMKFSCNAIAQVKQATILNWQEIYHQAVINLLGRSQNPCCLTGELYNEEIRLPLHQQANDRTAIFTLFFNKMILGYLFQEYQQAVESAVTAEQYLDGVTGTFAVSPFYLYNSLSKLAIYTSATNSEKKILLKDVVANQKKMQKWAHHAPNNHLHKFYLVEAEKYRILGKNSQVIDYYDRAIALAKANGYMQEEALANELAAKFYLGWGKERVAQAYLQESYYCYARWGAKAKTDDLEKRYPQLLQPILQQQRFNLNILETIAFSGTSSSTRTSTTDSKSISDVLDFTSLIKAAQAISSSLELDTLIASLTRIILENSGAKKCVLLLPQDDTWQVRAITFIADEKIQTVLETQSLDTCQEVPAKVINYVKNTQKTVVIDNCKTDISGLIGEYMLEYQPQSVLCVPINNQGYLVGILYLENNLTQGVFTSDRLSVINLLSSQAAISLENARLYQQAGQALQDLQQAQLQIVQSEKMSALGNLVAGIAHEMNNPLGFISASLKQAKPTVADITEHLKLYQETFPSPGEEIIDHAKEIDLDYSLEDLPKIIDAMVMACDRLKNISTSLRTFSRADKDYKVPFNIHEGIDSTILILKHRLKANEQRPAIDVITEYGDLPKIECFPGQLNQVFMNILANAIDALEDSNNGRSFEEIKANPNRIIIRTTVKAHQIKIAIGDNGVGMIEQVKEKIFSHLFTTKAVGKGTGLGLAIAHQIVVEKHKGLLVVNSIPGEGTEFIITIPILAQTLG